jgi:hypothetical protein
MGLFGQFSCCKLCKKGCVVATRQRKDRSTLVSRRTVSMHGLEAADRLGDLFPHLLQSTPLRNRLGVLHRCDVVRLALWPVGALMSRNFAGLAALSSGRGRPVSNLLIAAASTPVNGSRGPREHRRWVGSNPSGYSGRHIRSGCSICSAVHRRDRDPKTDGQRQGVDPWPPLSVSGVVHAAFIGQGRAD